MHPSRIRHALIAATALVVLPALADTTLPGTFCTSDGPTEKSATGLMLNKTAGPSGTTHFHCPIIRTKPVSQFGGTVTVTINARTNNNTADFRCYLRSVSQDNVTHDTGNVSFASAYYNNGYTMGSVQVSLPTTQASVNMRCTVPNMAGSTDAGIVWYRIEQ